jgi:hypothetical protein
MWTCCLDPCPLSAYTNKAKKKSLYSSQQEQNRDWNSRLSDMEHSASANYATECYLVWVFVLSFSALCRQGICVQKILFKNIFTVPYIIFQLIRNLIRGYIQILGESGSVMVKALCYKPEGRGFDTRWGEFLNLPNPSSRTRPWGLLSL